MEKLDKWKQTHSKSKNLEHNKIIMQKYLQPNSESIRKEEAQLIFKLRSRMTDVRMNFKGKIDTYECRACKIEEEDKKHIVECQILNKGKEQIEYDRIFNGTVREKMKIARRFKYNLEILEQEAIGL